MDIPRPRRPADDGSIGLEIGRAIVLGLSRLKPAPPDVERGTVWIDTVQPRLRREAEVATVDPMVALRQQ